jgi:hypothetical protein
MSFKDRVIPKLTNVVRWRLIFWALVLWSCGIAGYIWVSGIAETRDAMNNGLRLLVRLDDGSIEGKQTVLENKNPESKLEPESKPESGLESKPELKAAINPTVNPPASTVAVPDVHEALPAVATPLTGTTEPAVPSHAPIAALRENLAQKSDVGIVPAVASDGGKSWRYYARSYTRKGNRPMIAVIVTGLGQNKNVTDMAVKLPEYFSLSFSPYAKSIISWSDAARASGHEILMDLPLEPSNYPASDPGPYGLLVEKGAQENGARLQWLMSRTQGYIGFVAPQNEVFSAEDESLKMLLGGLYGHGLMLVMGHDPARNETKQLLVDTKTAHVVADALLDEELSAAAIQAKLLSLEQVATKRGYAIGVAQAFPLTIQQLNVWAAQLEKDGFVLVPVSYIAGLRFAS